MSIFPPQRPPMDDAEAWRSLDSTKRRERMVLAVATGYIASYANPGAAGLPSDYKLQEDILRIADRLLLALDETHG
jgi:hypothetical protein